MNSWSTVNHAEFSAATVDMGPPPYAEPDQLTGQSVRVKQAAAARNVHLPIARVSIGGPLAELVAHAVVSPQLLEYRYLFSNRSDQLLHENAYICEALPRKQTELAANGTSKDSVTTCERNGVTERESEDSVLTEHHDRRQHDPVEMKGVSPDPK